MIIYHQKNIAAFVGAHTWITSLQIILTQRISVTTAAVPGQPFYLREGGYIPSFVGLGVS